MAVALLALLLAYRGTIMALVGQWWGYLDHGFALVALVAWVAWRDRASLLAGNAPWWPAVVVMVFSTVLWFVCALAGIQSMEQLALLVVLLGWSLGVLGRAQQPRLIRMAAYLALALPAWGLITGPLQLLTVAANSVLLAMTGLQATISGTYITIPEGRFEVAAGCSGLNYFAAGMTVGFAYGEIMPLTRRGRLLALALMGALSLASNWVRVFLLILIGHWTNMRSSLMTDHVWFGWVVFAMMVAVFLAVSSRIEARYAVAAGASSERSGPREPSGAASPDRGPAAGGLTGRVLWSFTALAVLGPVGAALIQRAPREPAPPATPDLRVGPDWQLVRSVNRRPLAYGDTAAGEPWMPQYVGADRHQAQYWVKGRDTAHPVQVDRLIFSGRDHRHKLLALGNVMAHERALLLDRAIGVDEGTRVRSLRQAVVQVDSVTRRAVLYWFSVGGRTTGVPLVGRMLQIPASLRRRAPSELIAVSVPCATDCNTAFGSLQAFVVGPDGTTARRGYP